MLYLFDKSGRIGYIKINGHVSFCFDNQGRQIGRMAESGNYIFLYNGSGKLLASFNGRHTYDSHSNLIGKGNLLYNILYPTLAKIRWPISQRISNRLKSGEKHSFGRMLIFYIYDFELVSLLLQ